jgi:hypothetical protein
MQFVLNYNALATSEDDVKVSIGPNGLLTKVNVSSEDKTGAIVLKLVELGEYVAKAIAFAETGQTTVFDATFDPFNPVESERVRVGLAAFGYAYHLFRTDGSEVDPEAEPVSPTRMTSPSASGIAFRPVFAYPLVLDQGPSSRKRSRKSFGKPIATATVLLQNEAQIMTIPITRAAFVKKITYLGFDNGLLTEVDINKPSEALAFMDIPLAIAKAIVDIPAQIVQLKFNFAKANTDLLTQQRLEAQAQQALDNLRGQKMPSSPNVTKVTRSQ